MTYKTWQEMKDVEIIQKNWEDIPEKERQESHSWQIAWQVATPEQLVVLKKIREEFMASVPPGHYWLVEGDDDCTAFAEETKVLVLAQEAYLARVFGWTGTVEEIRQKAIDLHIADEDAVDNIVPGWMMDYSCYMEDVRREHQFKL